MEIIEGKALKLKLRNPHKVLNVIPKSALLEEGDVSTVMVHWGLEEAQVLKNLRIKNVPSPIVAKYSWPGIYQPFTHQKQTSAFFTLHRRAFCFNEPGTGKTLSVTWACDYLMNAKHIKRVLVICPLSIMQAAWQNDIFKGAMHRKVGIAYGSKEKRAQVINSDAEFVIINFDGVAVVEDVIANAGFDMIVIDEANAYKTVTTRRWKSLQSIVKPDTLLWMMTGTPASQSPADAYGLAKLVNANNVPRFFTAWRDSVMNKVTQFKWAPKANASELVHEALQPAIRFTKEQCLDLPPVITMTREVPLTPQQKKYYELLKERMLIQTGGETISAVNAAAGVSKLLQISCGAAYTDAGEVVEFDAAPRLAVLEEILEETSRKVIVFALFISSIDAIIKHLAKQGIPAEMIRGDVPASKRGDIIRRFQTDPEPRILVMQPQATAHGLTLTAADTVVFYGPLMSVEQYIQCIARADRKGQTSDKVTVLHIEGSPIERKMFKALTSKVSDHSLLTQLFESEIKS